MFAIAHTLAACWRWLAGAIRPKRHPNHHHRREAKEQ